MKDLLPLLVIVGMVLWAGAAMRLNKAAQPLRLQFAEKSEKLLGNPNLPNHLQLFIKYLQTTAFGNRLGLFFGIFYVPFIAFAILVRAKKLDGIGRLFWIKCPETRAQFHDVMRLHDRITFLNNPILLLLLEIEIPLLVAPAIALTAIFRGFAAEKIDREVTMGLIDQKSRNIRNRISLLTSPV
jgi:hypothetical protein